MGHGDWVFYIVDDCLSGPIRPPMERGDSVNQAQYQNGVQRLDKAIKKLNFALWLLVLATAINTWAISYLLR